MNGPCVRLDWDTLVAYRRAELPPSEEAELEAHLFTCDGCSGRLETLESLAAGLRKLMEGGAVAAGVTADLLARAEALGLQVRTYRLSPGEGVACTAAPEDDFVVVRLAVPFPTTADRVDVTMEGRLLTTGEETLERLEDVFVDSAVREVVQMVPGALIRSLPRSQWRFEVRVRAEGAERALGPYLLDHTPWDERLPDT